MDGYEVRVSYSSNDDCYVAELVEFVGCAVDGPTPEAALANLREAKEAWIKDVSASGFPIPMPRHHSEVSEHVTAAR
jgi:predicted RNase H-like HicB family nuclease